MQPLELLEFRVLVIGFVGFLSIILMLSNPKRTDTNLLLFNLFLFGLLILLSI